MGEDFYPFGWILGGESMGLGGRVEVKMGISCCVEMCLWGLMMELHFSISHEDTSFLKKEISDRYGIKEKRLK